MWAFRHGLQDQKTQQSAFWSLLIIFCFYLHYPPGCMLSHSIVFDLRPQELWPARSPVHGVIPAEHCSGLPFPPLGGLLGPGIEPASLASPELAGRFFTTEPLGKPVLSTFMDVTWPNRAFLFPTQGHTLSFTQNLMKWHHSDSASQSHINLEAILNFSLSPTANVQANNSVCSTCNICSKSNHFSLSPFH